MMANAEVNDEQQGDVSNGTDDTSLVSEEMGEIQLAVSWPYGVFYCLYRRQHTKA